MVDEEQNSIGPGKVPELAMSKMDKLLFQVSYQHD